MTVTFGYWDLRGIGESIRLMLKYAGTQYEEVRYSMTGETPDWSKDKYELGLPFPNLPYYIEDDLKLTQSKAILRHLGRKYGLIGQTESQNIRIDIIENQIEDFRKELRHVARTPGVDSSVDFETLKAEYIVGLDSRLRQISQFLSINEWMSGNKLTYVDFFCYEILDWNRLFKTDCLNAFPNLIDYMNRFEAIPQINRYIHSKQFNRLPIFGIFAKWGGYRNSHPTEH